MLVENWILKKSWGEKMHNERDFSSMGGWFNPLKFSLVFFMGETFTLSSPKGYHTISPSPSTAETKSALVLSSMWHLSLDFFCGIHPRLYPKESLLHPRNHPQKRQSDDKKWASTAISVIMYDDRTRRKFKILIKYLYEAMNTG